MASVIREVAPEAVMVRARMAGLRPRDLDCRDTEERSRSGDGRSLLPLGDCGGPRSDTDPVACGRYLPGLSRVGNFVRLRPAYDEAACARSRGWSQVAARQLPPSLAACLRHEGAVDRFGVVRRGGHAWLRHERDRVFLANF